MTASPYFFVFRSSMTVSRIKFEGRDSEGAFVPASLGLDEYEFAALMLFLFYMEEWVRGGCWPSLGDSNAVTSKLDDVLAGRGHHRDEARDNLRGEAPQPSPKAPWRAAVF
jgi:hypothetical protein